LEGAQVMLDDEVLSNIEKTRAKIEKEIS
jgi:hypothetical protein